MISFNAVQRLVQQWFGFGAATDADVPCKVGDTPTDDQIGEFNGYPLGKRILVTATGHRFTRISLVSWADGGRMQLENSSAPGNATQIQGVNVSAVAPTPGQVLRDEAGVWTPHTLTAAEVNADPSGAAAAAQAAAIASAGASSVQLTGVQTVAGLKTFTSRITANAGITPFVGTVANVTVIVSPGIGTMAFATNGLKQGESPGAGTGVQAFYDGTAWFSVQGGALVS